VKGVKEMRKSGIIRILMVMAAAMILSIAGQTYAWEDNTDRPGLNYKDFDLRAAEPGLCETECTRDEKCVAWTYVKPGIQGRMARCWLKHSVPSAQNNTCCVAGVKKVAETRPVAPVTSPAVQPPVSDQVLRGAPGSVAAPPGVRAPELAQIYKLEQLTEQHFMNLPDTAMIEFQGRQMSKQQFMREADQRAQQTLGKAETEMQAKADADFKAVMAEFMKEQNAEIEAHNARARADFDRLSQQGAANASRVEAIRNEAMQLNSLFKTASGEEKVQLEKKAGELLGELQRMGY
jgi:hypothetical protein